LGRSEGEEPLPGSDAGEVSEVGLEGKAEQEEFVPLGKGSACEGGDGKAGSETRLGTEDAREFKRKDCGEVKECW
jgi:hypothetical protein